MRPWELCLPSRGLTAPDAVELAVLAEELGYGGVWASEAAGHDAVALLAAISTQTSRARLGTSIVPSATRSPVLLAMGAATLAQFAPGRIAIGIGASSRVIIEEWHGRCFGKPLSAIRESLDILNQAFAGETTNYQGQVHSSRGFKLANPPTVRPDLFLAALGPAMRDLAARRFDGVILNFLPRSRSEEIIKQASGAGDPACEVAALVRVSVLDEAPGGERRLRKELASYLRVEQYMRWIEGMGYELEHIKRASDLEEMASQVPSDLLRDVSVLGDVQSCRAQLEQMCAAGVTPLVIPDTPVGDLAAMQRIVRSLSPRVDASTQRPTRETLQ